MFPEKKLKFFDICDETIKCLGRLIFFRSQFSVLPQNNTFFFFFYKNESLISIKRIV